MVRVRNLVLAIAAATALTSEMAYALGLGEITLKSALNQPLVAEIELLDAKTMAPGEVVPVLASAEDFNRAGVDRQYFLTDLTFTPVLGAGGRNVIRVTSSKPVREPYLNFLVEVLWPSGRLLREYTLLLDPPLYSPEIAASAAPQLPVTVPAPRQAAKSGESSANQRTRTAPAPAPAQASEYRTSARDTLWEIAEGARQNGTVHQTMLAIEDLNPNAFIDGNINRMKSGQVLRLPSADQINSRSQAEAIREVAEHNTRWRQAMSGATAGARQMDATQRNAAGNAPSRSEAGDNLRLVAPETGKSTAGSDAGTGDDAKALRDKLALAQENLDSSQRENLDLKDRLGDLQGQLDKLQRLMQLKDDQLANLQAQLAADGESATPGTSAAPQVAADAQDGNADSRGESPDVTAPTPEPSAATEAGKPAEQRPTPAPATNPTPPATETSGSDDFVTGLMANPMLLGVLGGSALLLLLIGLLALSRRNAAKEAELQEHLLTENTDDLHLQDGPQTDDLDSSAYNDVHSDAGVSSSFDPVAPAAGDPIAEADIYIAYGRFNQAAELLESALNDEPQRADLHLKLMEVYAELGDRDGFARQESELREVGGSATEIDQLKARYPAMVASAGFAASSAFAADENEFDSFSLDDLELDEPVASSALDQGTDDALTLSLDDLEIDSDEAPAIPDSADEQGESLELDELTFDELNLEAAEEEKTAENLLFDLDDEPLPEMASDDDLGGFSLDLDDEQPAASDDQGFSLDLDEELTKEPSADIDSDDFDFQVPETNEPSAEMPDEFDLSLEPEAAATPEPERFAAQLDEVEAELAALSRNLDESAEEPAAEAAREEQQSAAADELDEDFDFFTDTDETTTKLDLAKAYIDMGDAEGARDILDEVMNEGNDIQQQEARDMLAKLA